MQILDRYEQYQPMRRPDARCVCLTILSSFLREMLRSENKKIDIDKLLTDNKKGEKEVNNVKMN